MTNPQTWNGYAYVGNSPLTFTDPSGLFIEAAGPGSTAGPAGTIIGGLIDLGELFAGLFGLFGGGSSQPKFSTTVWSVSQVQTAPVYNPSTLGADLDPGVLVIPGLMPSPDGPHANSFTDCNTTLGGCTMSHPPKRPGIFYVCAPVETNIGWIDWTAKAIGAMHCWIQTNTNRAGMGPARGGPLPNNPIGIEVAITDQSDHIGAEFKRIQNADESCVNAQLQIGKSCGRWWPWNNCNTLASEIIRDCKTKH